MPEVYAVKYPNAENIRAIYLADIPFKAITIAIIYCRLNLKTKL
jgi:hypothetical protein